MAERWHVRSRRKLPYQPSGGIRVLTRSRPRLYRPRASLSKSLRASRSTVCGDALARPLAHRLSQIWGQQVVIENKGGAGGNFGAQMVAQAAPDGYTLLLGAAFLAINPFLYPSSGYSATADLSPVTLLTVIPNLMMVPNISPSNSVTEFIDYAKTGKVTFASTGIGASPHLSGELFKRKAGIEMTHVPYRGAGPAMNDLIPGRVDAMFSNLPGVISQVQTGTIRGTGCDISQALTGFALHSDNWRITARLRSILMVGSLCFGKNAFRNRDQT